MKIMPLLVGLLIVSMVSAVSGITVVSSSSTNIITHSDGTFTMVSPNQLEAAPLEAGDVADNQRYVVVQMSNGVWELVPEASLSNLESSSLEAAAPLEAVTKLYSTAAECSSNCATYANNYCGATGGWNIQCLQYSTTGINRKCSYECRGNKCTSASDCAAGAQSCSYGCRIDVFKCTSGVCSGGTCGSATQCGKGCTSDADAKTKCIEAYAGSSRAVISATCDSSHQPICKTDVRSGIACSSITDPKCKTLATAACTYGVSSSTCNMEKDCSGSVYASNCEWNCNHAPTTQVCGDKQCTGTETKTNCPGDCGCTLTSQCSTGQTCVSGKCITGGGVAQCGTNVNSCGTCPAGANCAFGSAQETTTQYIWFCGDTRCVINKSVAPKVNGVCGAVDNVNSCTSGVRVDVADTTTQYLWNCAGTGGGTTANCAAAKTILWCGDNICNNGETEATCYQDCEAPDTSVCGDNRCTGKETVTTCYQDCKKDECGDGSCGETENEITCASDCYIGIAECGNTLCDAGEDYTTCPAECPNPEDPANTCIAGAVGEVSCDGIELVQEYQSATCEKSIQVITSCDIACDPLTSSCTTELPPVASICPSGTCDSDESATSCPDDCLVNRTEYVCGNKVCESALGETKANCKNDCSTGGGSSFDFSGADTNMIILIAVIVLGGILAYVMMRSK